MATFIFPIGDNVNAGIIEAKLKTLPNPVRTMSNDPNYRETSVGVLRRNGNVETFEKAPTVEIDTELPLTINDLSGDASFGNGVTIGEVLKEDGTRVRVGIVVVNDLDLTVARNQLTRMKAIFKGLE